MATLLLLLKGPMQSWGTMSRFDKRDTGKEPSKSGVLGLLAAALGIDRDNWNDLEPLTRLKMAVRHDRPGVLRSDYQTFGCANTDTIIKADGKQSSDGGISQRDYLADAAFLVGLEGEDLPLLQSIQEALKNPKWPLCLGRKSYLPSEMIWFIEGVFDEPLMQVMRKIPWNSSLRHREKCPEWLHISFESNNDGVLRMDQPLSSFSLRKFGSRFVKSVVIPFPQEVSHVSP